MTIETLTINVLRTKTANTANIYYTTNIGQEGEWYYDAVDTTTIDNTGTIITSPSITDTTNTSSRIVFKRIIDGEINIEWFGAKGDYYLPNGSLNTSPTNNTAAIEEAIKLNTTLFFPKGVYLVYNITFPNTCNVHFAQGARIMIQSFQKVIWASGISATPDQWIFECIDYPSNYKNENDNQNYDPYPLIFYYVDRTTGIPYFNQNSFSSKVSVKWFGATGAGYIDKLANGNNFLSEYSTKNYVPEYNGTERLYVDDTLYINFALAAIASGLETPHPSVSNAFAGPVTLYFPKGCYVFTNPLHVSAGTFLEGEGGTPIGGSQLFMMWPGGIKWSDKSNDKDLARYGIILQAKGAGGLGGGGGAHILRDLVISCRPTGGPTGEPATSVNNNLSSIIKFEDNVLDYDTRFYNIRFSNAPMLGSVIYINDKNSRWWPYTETGLENDVLPSGLDESFHIYNSMIDVCQGDFIKLGPKGSGRFRLYDCQFFDVWQSIVNNPDKPEYIDFYTNPNTGERFELGPYTALESLFEFRNCNFEGCGLTAIINISPPRNPCIDTNLYNTDEYSPFVYGNDEKGSYYFSDCIFNSRAIDEHEVNCQPPFKLPARVGGGRFKIEKAKILSIVDSHFYYANHLYTRTNAHGEVFNYNLNSQYAYLLELRGHIDTLEIVGNTIENNNGFEGDDEVGSDFSIRLGIAETPENPSIPYSAKYLTVSNNIFKRNFRSHISAVPDSSKICINGLIEANQFSPVIGFYSTLKPNAIYTETKPIIYGTCIITNNVFNTEQEPLSMAINNYGMIGGANFGEIYIDPINGLDSNFGFHINLPIKTFDKALELVNQRTDANNTIQIIRIKESTTTIKNNTIKELENCNILITGYIDDDSGANNPTIYFDGDDARMVGEILLKGNVLLYFRNVNLICNATYQWETPLNQQTIFSLKQSYAKIIFDNLTINLSAYYSLIKSNGFNNAMVETKFINTQVLGTSVASLSPSNGGIINLLVDNIQIGSSLSPSIYAQFSTGWLDSNTIRNNF